MERIIALNRDEDEPPHEVSSVQNVIEVVKIRQFFLFIL